MTTSNQKLTIDHKNLLRRPRIHQLFEDSLQSPLILLTAGAGYGKTQSTLSYVSELDADVVWIQLTESDNYSKRFWQGFTQALSIVDQKLSKELELSGFPDDLASFHLFLQQFSDLVYRDRSFVVVFDDCHLIEDHSVLRFIENLVLANLENMNIFVLSREDFTSTFYILESKGLVYHINAEHLAFTGEEAYAYFNLHGMPLAERTVLKLHTQTEGWPFAIYLTYLHMKRNGTAGSDNSTFSLPAISDMIENEIFANYSTATQYLLLKLSLLDHFSTDFIREIDPDHCEEFLMSLDTNMFVSYNTHTRRYYFHHLFLEFLRKKQPLLEEEEKQAIYKTTADWYLRSGNKMDALIIYQKYNDYQAMWDIIWGFNPGRFSENESKLYGEIIESFPDEFTAANPLTKVIYACLNNARLDLESSIALLSEVIDELEQAPMTDKIRTALGEAYIMMGFYHMIRGSLEFKDCFIAASDHLPNGSTMFTKKFLVVNNDFTTIINEGKRGELVSFIKAMFETMPYTERILNGSGYGREYLALAEGNYITNNLKKATEYVYQAIYKGMDYDQADIVCNGYFLLVRMYVASGSYEEAMSALKQMRVYADSYESDSFFILPDCIDGWFHSRMDDTDNIAPWLYDEVLYDSIQVPQAIGRERLIKAYILLNKQRYHELIAFTEELEIIYVHRNLFIPLIFLYVLRALAFYNTGDYKNTVTLIEKAYQMSYQNYITIPFIEHGTHTCSLMAELKQDPDIRIPKKWIESIYSNANTYAKRLAYVKTKYQDHHADDALATPDLTDRERGILRLLCEGMTREDIADEISVSVNTVKYALKSIYAKLGAINGIDAARIAAVRGLI